MGLRAMCIQRTSLTAIFAHIGAARARPTTAVFLTAKQAQIRGVHVRLDVLAAGIIGPTTEVKTPFHTDQTALTDIFPRDLSLASPNFYIKPVRLFLFCRAINGQRKSRLDASRLKITHFRITTGPSNKN